MAYPENIMLAMLGDDDEQVRTAAVDIIIASRQTQAAASEVGQGRAGPSTTASEHGHHASRTSRQPESSISRRRTGSKSNNRAARACVRRFQVPPAQVNRCAATYKELQCSIEQIIDARGVEPPFMKGLTQSQLRELATTPLRTGIPCHTQSTERAVKLTTESVSSVCGADRQDGKALNKKAFRQCHRK